MASLAIILFYVQLFFGSHCFCVFLCNGIIPYWMTEDSKNQWNEKSNIVLWAITNNDDTKPTAKKIKCRWMSGISSK